MSTVKDVAHYILAGLNGGHGAFALGMGIFGIYMGLLTSDMMGLGLAAIGLILGLLLLFVALKMLLPKKKQGWMYALILNFILIPMYLFLPGYIPIYGITFAVLVIIIMIIPTFREPFK